MQPRDFETRMNILTASQMRSPINEKQMTILFEKFSKCDAEIFAIAIEKLSLGDRMPKVGEIFTE